MQALFDDSFALIEQNKDKKFDFDFYLELFKMRYNKKELPKLLKAFNIRRVNLSNNNETIKKYSKILETFERTFDKIFQAEKSPEMKENYKEYY